MASIHAQILEVFLPPEPERRSPIRRAGKFESALNLPERGLVSRSSNSYQVTIAIGQRSACED